MRQLTAAITQQKNKLDAAGAFLPLITVYVDAATVLRFVPNPLPIVFDGETYIPFGCEIGEVVHDAKGGLNDLSISVANVTREMSAYIEFTELRGARVTIAYVHSDHLADPLAVVLEERYEIMSIQVKGDRFVTFTLGHDRIAQHRFPSGHFYRDNCRWIYKSMECGYSGGLPTCDKVLEGANGCRAHANVPRFGGFPLLVARR
ncbi:MAG: hypothetical protein OEY77_00165 [Nitrospira sp.]|nr:hypothetical protein [Nitrospira sp.]